MIVEGYINISVYPPGYKNRHPNVEDLIERYKNNGFAEDRRKNPYYFLVDWFDKLEKKGLHNLVLDMKRDLAKNPDEIDKIIGLCRSALKAKTMKDTMKRHHIKKKTSCGECPS